MANEIFYNVQDEAGAEYRFSAPEGLSDEEVLKLYDAQFIAPEYRPINDFTTSVGRGADSLQLGAGNVMAGVGRMLENRDFAKESNILDLLSSHLTRVGGSIRKKQIEDLQATQAGTVNLDDVTKAWEADEWFRAADLLSSLGTQALGEQALLFGSLIGTSVGAAAVAGPGAGVGAGMGLYTALMYGENLEQQEEAISKGYLTELDDAAALKTAPFQAALGYITDMFLTRGLTPAAVTKILGLNPAGGIVGKGGLFTTMVRNYGTGAIVETPTEVGEQVLARFQANMPLDDEEAMDEYWNVAVAAGIVGGTVKSATGAIGDFASALQSKVDDADNKKGSDRGGEGVARDGVTSEENLANIVEGTKPPSLLAIDVLRATPQFLTMSEAEWSTYNPEYNPADLGMDTRLTSEELSNLDPQARASYDAAMDRTRAKFGTQGIVTNEIFSEIDTLRRENAAGLGRKDIIGPPAPPEIVMDSPASEFDVLTTGPTEGLFVGPEAPPEIVTDTAPTVEPVEDPLIAEPAAELDKTPLRNIFNDKVSDEKVAELEVKGLVAGDILRHGTLPIQKKFNRDGFIAPPQANRILRAKKESAERLARQYKKPEERPSPTRQGDPQQLKLDFKAPSENQTKIENAQNRLDSEDQTVIENRRRFEEAVDKYEAIPPPVTSDPTLVAEYEAARTQANQEVEIRRAQWRASQQKYNYSQREVKWRKASNILARSVAAYNDTVQQSTALLGELNSRKQVSLEKYQEMQDEYTDLITLQISQQKQVTRDVRNLIDLSQAYRIAPEQLRIRLKQLQLEPSLMQDPSTFGLVTPRQAEDVQHTQTLDLRRKLSIRLPALAEAGRIEVYDSYQAALDSNAAVEPGLPPETPGFLNVSQGTFYMFADAIPEGSELAAFFHVAGTPFQTDNLLGRRFKSTYKKFISDVGKMDISGADPLTDNAKIVMKRLMDKATQTGINARTQESENLESALRTYLNVEPLAGMGLQGVLQYLGDSYRFRAQDANTEEVIDRLIDALGNTLFSIYVVSPNQEASDVLPNTIFTRSAEVLEKWDRISKGELLGTTIIKDASNQMILLRGTGFTDKAGSGLNAETIIHEAGHVATEAKILDAVAFRGFDVYYSLFAALEGYLQSPVEALPKTLRRQLNFLVSAGVIKRNDKGTYVVPKDLPTTQQLLQDRDSLLAFERGKDPRLEIWTGSNKYALKIFQHLSKTSNETRQAILLIPSALTTRPSLPIDLSTAEIKSIAAVHQMQQVYRAVQRNAKSKAYGLTSLDEFIAEGLSNPEFRKMIKDSLPKQSGKFKTSLQKVLGVEGAGVTTTFNDFMEAAIVTLDGPPPRMTDVIAAAAEGSLEFSPEGRESLDPVLRTIFKDVWDSTKSSLARNPATRLTNLDLNADNLSAIVRGSANQPFRPPPISMNSAYRMFDKISDSSTLNNSYFNGISQTVQGAKETARDLGDYVRDHASQGVRGGWASSWWYSSLSLNQLSKEVRRWSPTLANLIDAIFRIVTKRRNRIDDLRRKVADTIGDVQERIRDVDPEVLEDFYELMHESSMLDNNKQRHDLRAHFRRLRGEALTAEDQRVLNSEMYRRFMDPRFSPELREVYELVVNEYESLGDAYFDAVANTLYSTAVEEADIKKQQAVLDDPASSKDKRDAARKELGRLNTVVRSRKQKLALAKESKDPAVLLDPDGKSPAPFRRIMPYIPLVRRGDFWVKEVRDDDSPPRVESYTTLGEAEREAKKLIAEGKKLVEAQGGGYVFKRGPGVELGTDSVAVRSTLTKLLEKMREMGYEGESLETSTREMFLNTFPAESLMRQRKGRRENPGYEPDILSNLGTMGLKFANQIAMLETADELSKGFGAIDAFATAQMSPKVASVVNTMTARAKFLRDPNPNRAAAFLAYGGFFSYILFNISSALVNLTQLPLMAFGLFGSEFGYANASNTLVAGMRMYASGGRDVNTALKFGRVKLADWTMFAGKNMDDASLLKRFGTFKGKPLLTKREMEELRDAAYRSAAVRRSSAQELQDVRANSVKSFTNWYARLELLGGWLFQNSERMNREVALVTSYILSKKKYAGATPDQLRNRATLSVEEINGPSLAETGPQWMQDGFGKVIGTFKKYAFHMTYAQYTMARNAFSQLDKIEQNNTDPKVGLPEGMPSPQTLARHSFLGIMIPAFALAGIRGLPFYGAASVLYHLLSDDEEDPPFDEFIRQNTSDIAFNGVLSHVTGASIMSRTGFYGHMPYERPLGGDYRASQIGPSAYLFESILGPVYSATVGNADRAARIYDRGGPNSFRHAVAAVLPAGMRNMSKAYTMGVDGVRDKTGTLIAETGARDVFYQMMGFVPLPVQQGYSNNSFMTGKYRRIMRRNSKIRSEIFYAMESGDEDGLERALKKRDRYNADTTVRELGVQITPKKLRKSIQDRRKWIREHENRVGSSAPLTIDTIRVLSEDLKINLDPYGYSN